MGKRLSVDEKLSAIRRLRALAPSTEVTGELCTALRDKSNLVVAAAATIIGDQGHTTLTAELEAAFQRHMVDPLTSDKLCLREDRRRRDARQARARAGRRFSRGRDPCAVGASVGWF